MEPSKGAVQRHLPLVLVQQQYAKTKQAYEEKAEQYGKAEARLIRSYLHELERHVQKLAKYEEKYEALSAQEREQFRNSLDELVKKTASLLPEKGQVMPFYPTPADAVAKRDAATQIREMLAYPAPPRTPAQKAAYTKKQKRIAKEEERAAEEMERVAEGMLAEKPYHLPYHFNRKEARLLREQAEYTQLKLARKLKISQRYIAGLEQGEVRVLAHPRGEKMLRYLAWLEKQKA